MFKLFDMNPKVDPFFIDGCGRCKLYKTPECKVHKWPKELALLRQIMLSTGLAEELKWSMPTYVYKKSNLFMIAAFKESCTLSFFKGALLADEHKVLVMPGENSQSARFMKFTSIEQVKKMEPIILSYVQETIELEKAGAKVVFKKADEYEMPIELTDFFKTNKALKQAFEALTPGRKRGYLLHFTSAKQSATRISRIEKCMPAIMQGKGMQD